MMAPPLCGSNLAVYRGPTYPIKDDLSLLWDLFLVLLDYGFLSDPNKPIKAENRYNQLNEESEPLFT